jgi:hypothetical protein
MNGSALKILTESILDGVVIDDVIFYQMLNVVKNIKEEKRDWVMLRKLDDSQSVSAGNNYASDKTIPADERREYKVMLGIDTELIPVGFEEQHIYRNSSHRYYNDIATGKWYVLGNVGRADTLYRFYIKTTDDITDTTSPVWPSRFHPILAFSVASYYMNGVDFDDVHSQISPENKQMASDLYKAMETWDMGLQARAQDNRVGVANSQPGVSLEQM